MAYFTPDYIQFFKDLAANNNHDWFQAHKKRYEQNVKAPFEAFVAALIEAMHKEDATITISPKEAIFRIHRDVRFSTDKTPYKLNSSAIVGGGGKQDHTKSGMYIELGPEKLAIYGGIYMPEKEALMAIRLHIANNLKKFDALINHPDFVASYSTVHGERNKMLPAELKEAAAKQPIIFNKGFYFYHHMQPEAVLHDDLVDEFMKQYRIGKPLGQFLSAPLH